MNIAPHIMQQIRSAIADLDRSQETGTAEVRLDGRKLHVFWGANARQQAEVAFSSTQERLSPLGGVEEFEEGVYFYLV